MSESTVKVACPACQTTVAIPASWLGKRRPCPQCHGWVNFPVATDGPTPNTLLGAPPDAAAASPAASSLDPYGNTLVSHPGLPTASGNLPAGAGSTNAPLTFADRLRQAAADTTTGPNAAGSAPNAPQLPRPARPAADWSSTARTPGSGPSAGTAPGASYPPNDPRAAAKINYGRDRVGESAAQRRQSRQADGTRNEWDQDEPVEGWSNRAREEDVDGSRGSRVGRGGRRPPPREAERQSTLGMLGLGAALFSLLTCGVACLGVIGAINASPAGGGPNSPQSGWFMIVGCAVLLTPVINLAGAIMSGIALAQAGDKKAIPIIGLAINGLLLLSIGGLLCIGMMN